MTASRLLRPADSRAQEELDNFRPHSPPPATPIVLSTTTTARKRPRTSSTSSSPAPLSWASNYRLGLPPYPPSNSYQANNFVELELTRPQKQVRPHTSDARHTQLPHIRNNVDKSSHRSDDIERGNHFGVGGGGGGGGDISLRRGGSDGWFKEKDKGTSEGTTKLSKAAKVMEEDRKKVASIRSFLLNFLEERDCSIKKRLDLCVHQTETGRPVTDAVVQEICKLRPDMIGLGLRDCTEVTDVGLWCVARHTTALRELNVSHCQSVTNIGLRSLAIRCDKMELLDFTGCTRLNDLGLRVIGGGCWNLRSLTLESCAHVSDSGVADLAKMCTGLKYLNISRCDRVGEYGDRALIQLGRSCHQLEGLDAFGCSHAQDPGLLAVARGCPKLEKLMLTGCGAITGKSVRALARGCVKLKDLSLSGCGGVGNGDLKALAKGCTALRHLNIAECAQVNAHGLAALASGLKNLTELDVGGCERVDDSALRALCCMNAHFLNLSKCAAITETGVAGIAKNCTALSSLNVTGCPAIGRRFMAELCHSMKLSEPAQDFFGFQPRKNAKELLAKVEAENRRIYAAIMVQSAMRGRLARGRASIVKRNWIVKTCLARAQAIIRGYFARKWYRTWQAQVREQRAAAAIQATWRMLGDRRTTERLRAEKLAQERGEGLATKIQAGWWGYRGRVRMREIRAVRARRLFTEARIQARKELSSITIQSDWRCFAAKKQLWELRRLRDEAAARRRLRENAAILIQSIARMRVGRVVLAALKAERDLKILEWEMALRVQTAWHGRKARMMVTALRILREEKLQKEAATTIQSFWRAVRARHLTSIQRAMFKIRQMQGGASKDIQRVYRGFKGRLRAKALRNVFESDLGRDAAAATIQRIYRGHKGRERFECKQHLRLLEDQVRPLIDKLDELSAKAVKFTERTTQVTQAAGILRGEQEVLREEIYHIRHTKDKYTDSDKINGCPQRFLTRFLQVRLVELQTIAVKKLEVLDTEAIGLEVQVRRNGRLLRQTEREVLPLGRGTVEKVKLLRHARLRKKVRTERRGAITIQRTFRGWRVRKAVTSWYRDYWVETEDNATGDVYYVNTWNQEIRWVKPLEMSLFDGSAPNTRPSTGTTEDSMADRFDGPADSIGSRFSQRYKELTRRATEAAEEEARLVRYAAATQNADMITAAGRWTFVTTDRCLEPTKCWHRASTSEYYWGDIPPLLRPHGLRDANTGESLGVGEDAAGEKGIHTDVRDTGLGFPDRAAGESWLKGQDATLLLVRSEAVRKIGQAGWRQLQAPPLHVDATPTPALEAEAAESSPMSTVSAGSITETKSAADGEISLRENGGHGSEEPVSPPGHGLGLGIGGGAGCLPSFTFFHHAEKGEIRWCLSPRSALATPRTPRREVSRDWPGSSHQEQSGGGQSPSEQDGAVTLGADDRDRGDDSGSDSAWEVVEDGDVIFYYNRRLGISSWEPPPGWVHDGDDIHG